MSMMSRIVAGSLAAAAIFAVAPAQATAIPDGNAALVSLKTATVTFGTPNSFTINAKAAVAGASGGFAGADSDDSIGKFLGTLNFAGTVGTTLDETIADFLTFDDGAGGKFAFTVDHVTTTAIASSAFTLYLLGTTLDTTLGYDPTATSMTLQFNSTGGSGYAVSASLAVPPVPQSPVPEPATWALSLLGFGAMGAALRRRPHVTSVSFA